MTASTFDTLTAARALKAAGIEPEHAEAIAEGMRQAATADHDELATKGDLASLRADLKADNASLRADLYRALWIQGGAIVAILTALRFFPA